jgi:glycosyltransferase involved in cell wall biosynthesis
VRVLHLPVNIASQMSTLVTALRDLGIDARGIAYGKSPLNDSDGIETFDPAPCSSWAARRAIQLVFKRRVMAGITWADVVHWHFNASAVPFELDLRWAARLRRARIVEFHGTDIRIPEIAGRDNPYIRRLFTGSPSAYGISLESSRETQRRFARYGFIPLLPGPELEMYLQPDIFSRHYSTNVAMGVSNYAPSYPDPGAKKPLIVHLPSNPLIKGTSTVLKAIDEIRDECDFEFRLIENLSHAEAMRIVSRADIVLDQFLLGMYGLSAVEGMAHGKPTVVYLAPKIADLLGPGLPLVNSSPDNLGRTLVELIADGERRRRLGVAGRDYVQRVHDSSVVACGLLEIYEDMLNGRGR